MALEIRELDASAARRHRHQLAAILVDAVQHGASVSFLQPFSLDDSLAFWDGVIDKMQRGDLFLLAAFEREDLLGTAQLYVRMPPNQPHRAEVAKVLVHSRARRQGIARRLVEELERIAVREGKWLLVLDTVTGSPAEALYRGLGYSLVGPIPDYALMPDGVLCGTSVFYKRLREGAILPEPKPAGAAALVWIPVQPGAEMLALAGDPEAADSHFVVRYRVSRAITVPAHWHPQDEHITLLEGLFELGFGSRFDAAALRMFSPGEYLRVPRGQCHFTRYGEGTVVQVHGVGPLVTHYVEAANV